MADPTGNYRQSYSAEGAAAITKSDSVSFPQTRGLYVGGTGNVKVTMAGSGAVVTFTSVPAGMILPISVTRVWSTDTTASGFVGLS